MIEKHFEFLFGHSANVEALYIEEPKINQKHTSCPKQEQLCFKEAKINIW